MGVGMFISASDSGLKTTCCGFEHFKMKQSWSISYTLTCAQLPAPPLSYRSYTHIYIDLWTTQVSKCSPTDSTSTPLLIFWSADASVVSVLHRRRSSVWESASRSKHSHSDTDTMRSGCGYGEMGIFSGAVEWWSDACERWKLPDFSQTTDQRHLLLFCTENKSW